MAIPCLLSVSHVNAEIESSPLSSRYTHLSSSPSTHWSDRFSWDSHIHWDSKYISEGRDNLAEGGLFSAAIDGSIELDSGSILAGVWHAEADDVDYNELNLFAGYSNQFAEIDWTLGYTRLEFIKDDLHDNEISLGLSKNFTENLLFGVESIYSTEANGTFFETYLSYDYQLNDKLSLNSQALLGINQNYVTGEHDGLNNFQLSLEATYQLRKQLSVSAYIAFTSGIDKGPNDSLEDLFFAGTGLNFSF